MLKQGDTVPGHVLMVEARDSEGTVHLVDTVDLDHPFLGLFQPWDLYEAWRFDIVPKVSLQST